MQGMKLRINAARLLADIEALAQIGGTPDGGVSRPALSPADLEGRAWFRGRAEGDGFEWRQDGAGNLSAVLRASDPSAPTLLAGSHLDTVPDGGRFDGALGVLAALEALRTLREAGVRLPVHLEAIAFTDEEGHVLGLLGSRALTGQITPEDLERPRGGRAALADGMQRLGLTREGILAARRRPESLAGYVELHIEQGRRLEDAGIDIGVVTAIVGIRSCWLRFVGQAAHAGTTPMPDRADALLGAADFATRARALVMARFAPGVVNCGQVCVAPGAFNIVPGEARLALEFRHGADADLDAMESALLALAAESAQRYRLKLEVEPGERCAPALMHESVTAAIEGAAAELGLSHTRLLSFAGHDAQIMSAVTPTAMLFVPSQGGMSHNPREFTTPGDVVNGANVLLHTLLKLAF